MLNPKDVPSKKDSPYLPPKLNGKTSFDRPPIHRGATKAERLEDTKKTVTALKAAATRELNKAQLGLAKSLPHAHAPSKDATLINRDGTPKKARNIAENLVKASQRVRCSTKENYVSKGATRSLGGLTYVRQEPPPLPTGGDNGLRGRDAIRERRRLKRLKKKLSGCQ